ncbi:MAG: hypothetical protein HZA15_15410 [Nitrospirae bacterium]|nr:hypothetical protein [Nitrospirota bacterium]
MSLLKCCFQNILETSTVTIGAGSASASYPLYRLSDRNIGRLFKAGAAETLKIKIDQWASPLPVDRLLIPSGHNLSGMTSDVEWSTDDISYTPAITQWAGAAGLINKEYAAALTKRYWQFTLTNPAAVPQFAELFLTSTYTWERNPSRPAGPFDDEHNTENIEYRSGGDGFAVYGPAKRVRNYLMPSCGAAQLANILALNAAWAGSKPFWLCDENGVWIYGKLTKKIETKEIAAGAYSFDFNFKEVLGIT